MCKEQGWFKGRGGVTHFARGDHADGDDYADDDDDVGDDPDDDDADCEAVAYTHLTLPTKRIAEDSAGGAVCDKQSVYNKEHSDKQ